MRIWIASTLLGLNLIFIFCVTVLMFPGHHTEPNVIPFRVIINDWKAGGWAFLINFVGNLAVFAPVGVLIPLARRRPTRAWQVALFCLAFSAAIEVTQYVAATRVADVDDLLLNTLGGLAGYGLLRAWRPARPDVPES